MRRIRNNQSTLQEPWLDVDHAKELAKISKILDEHPRIRRLVAQDLHEATGAQKDTGAHGMSAEQVLRALIVKQANGFSYRELAFHLEDSRTYRKFCRLGVMESAPSKSALQANVKALRAETLERINGILVEIAEEEGIENGRKVRVDSTAVESDIHHPTDSELLWDCIRVTVRLMRRAREILGADVVRFSDRRLRAKRRRKEINTARRRKHRKRPYRDLLKVAREVRGYGEDVRETLRQEHGLGVVDGAAIDSIASELDRFLPLMQRVIDQTERRVFEGESVPASEKVVSIFEPHTDIIAKGGLDITYGHKVCLAAGTSSMVLDCVVLEGNPPDSSLAVPMADRQTELYDDPPRQIVFDGAFATKDNLATIKVYEEIDDVVFSKKRGFSVSDMARSTWVYRRLQEFRAGIEGIVSYLKRVFGLSRCTWRSLQSFRSYVWSSVVACNLMVMARALLA